MSDLPIHPASAEQYPTDHRDSENRDQLREPSHLHGIWRQAVEQLADELQVHPGEAHRLLKRAAGEVTNGTAWTWWPERLLSGKEWRQ